MAEVELVDRGASRFWVRHGTCDEEVLRARYARSRFFARERRLSREDIVVDLGAHIGAFTIVAARAVPCGYVYAVEPAADTFELLARNVAVNGLDNVTACQLAVSDGAGKATLHRGADSWADSLCGNGTAGSEAVETMTLEGFLEVHGIARVDYMKMNVEGSEYGILLVAPEWVLRRVRCMQVEHHLSAEHDPSELVGHLRGCGFTVTCTPEPGETGKGWLTATR